ncbi:hypothetical protein D3C84_879010 [compost metagenome]
MQMQQTVFNGNYDSDKTFFYGASSVFESIFDKSNQQHRRHFIGIFIVNFTIIGNITTIAYTFFFKLNITVYKIKFVFKRDTLFTVTFELITHQLRHFHNQIGGSFGKFQADSIKRIERIE